jgi:hypothetical protein
VKGERWRSAESAGRAVVRSEGLRLELTSDDGGRGVAFRALGLSGDDADRSLYPR